MLCVPTAKLDTVKEALPLLSTVTIPRALVPSVMLTEPDGIPVPEVALTVTVSKVD